MKNIKPRILLVGGGSGGHVYPLVAVANALIRKTQESGVNLEMRLWGDGDFLKKAGEDANLKPVKIIAGKLRRYFSLLNILDFFKSIVGFIQAMWLMYWYMPDMVFTKGGYVSVMPAIAAKLYMIPVFIHESDSTPGLANRIISKISNTIFISFASSAKYFDSTKVQLVGNPIRSDIVGADRTASMANFNLDANKRTILVLGGSQGAKNINDLILNSLVQLVEKYQIIHQSGDNQYGQVKTEVEKYQKEGESSYGGLIASNYKLYPFLNKDELRSAYSAADIIISRGGSGLLFEIAAAGKPAIIIPLSKEASRGDQIDNAAEFLGYGAVILEEGNLTPHILISQIEHLLKPENYASVSEKIRSFAKPDAADKIAETLWSGL